MQDGRSLMSSWTPESVVDRQYWQDNASQFRGRACRRTGCTAAISRSTGWT